MCDRYAPTAAENTNMAIWVSPLYMCDRYPFHG